MNAMSHNLVPNFFVVTDALINIAITLGTWSQFATTDKLPSYSSDVVTNKY